MKGNSSKEQQACKQAQLDANPADVCTAKQPQQQQQRALFNRAGGNKQHLVKVTGLCKFKRAASKQVMAAGDGSLAPQ